MATLSPSQFSRRPNIGFVRVDQVERAFLALLYVTVVVLVALSILGTFYGAQAATAPIVRPLQVWSDITGAPLTLTWAVVGQVALTLAQYGARQFAQKDRRFWLLYVAALSVSLYFNFQAYWEPLTAMFAWYVTIFLLLIGDIVPEFVAVRGDP
jgi:hypothetical protein